AFDFYIFNRVTISYHSAQEDKHGICMKIPNNLLKDACGSISNMKLIFHTHTQSSVTRFLHSGL
uniref:Uncharacterized protein n=1 Tax=Castor canadensis TaxID=51338 RepID=A0A8C0W985_CASCN